MISRDIPTLLAALGGSVLLLRCKYATWQPLFRAARLLLWLLVPIFLLHLIFTPGQLIWPGSDIPFTREGMLEGVWLALRLCTLFYTAMLLSGSLSREEWALYCLRMPLIGPLLFPYVKLATPMRAMVSRGMVDANQQLHASGGLRDTPRMLHALGSLIAEVWHGSAAEAEAVWQSWDDDAAPREMHARLMPGLLLGLCGLAMPIAAWMN